MLALYDDFREGFRRVRRNPRSSLLAVGTLGLGLGASAAVFTLAHTVLLAPPPYRAPDQIVTLQPHRPSQTDLGISSADFFDYRLDPGLFRVSALVDYAEFTWTGQSLPGFDGAEVLRGMAVSVDYFRILDQPLAVGRSFAVDEDQPGRDQVVILSYALWQQRFGGRPDIAGQTLTLNNRVRTIIGIAGPGFLPYQSYDVQAWVPTHSGAASRDSFQFECIARLAAPLAQAQQRLDAINARLAAAYPASHRGYTVTLEPLLAGIRKETGPALRVLCGAVICLLLIAAANVAGLLLVRATTQGREMAIRAALGAGRLRLYRMMFAESSVLALASSVIGALFGAWLLAGAKTLVPAVSQSGWMFAIDARVFTIAFLFSAFAGLIAGLAPAFESFRLSVGGLRPTIGHNRLMRAVVAAEIALACLLLVGTGLLAKSFVAFLHRPLGYHTDHLLGLRVWVPSERYKTSDQRANYWSQLLQKAAAIPGVSRAATVSDLPMGQQYSGGYCLAGAQTPVGGERLHCHYLIASPRYFATVGIPVLQGRSFTESDGSNSEPVAIVSDQLAEQAWPGQDPIGRQIKPAWDNQPWCRVIGVVHRIRHGGPDDRFENGIYLPYRQMNFTIMFLVLRTHVPPESIIPAVRSTLTELDRNVPAYEFRSMENSLERDIALPRLPVILTTAFASLAVFLAGLGLFGVIAYWVAQRTRELGIRAALGAHPAELRKLVLGQGAKLAIFGIVAGLATSFVVVRYLHSLLYGMNPRDPLVYGGATLVAAVTAILACWVPAIRCSRIDPAVALRENGNRSH